MAPSTSASACSCALALRLLLQVVGATGADIPTGRGGFCCWAADDLLDFCGTCLPMAIAGPTSYCSKSQAACGSCGAATWCEQEDKTKKRVSTGTEMLLSFDALEAPKEGEVLSILVGGKSYDVTVVEASFEAIPTPAPTPAAEPAPTPEPEVAPVEGSLTPNVDAVKQHGRLSVKGNTIVGEHGLPVRLRGMSMFWSQWMGQFWNPEAIRWLKKDWHVSFIRAAMGVEQGGYLDDPDGEKTKLQAVVDTCIEEGIYVVIDWHDYHAEEHVEQAKAFFSEMAQKYGDKPNVLFETYNEPQQISWSDTIKPYHEQIVPVIREHSENIIILGTRTWSQEVDVASQDPVEGENLAYTIHFYAASMGADLREKVSTALSNGVAIFATEWGTCEYTGDGRLDLGETQAWLDFFEDNHISDSNWGVSDKEESCSALHGGSSGTGGWSDGDLTESGQFVRNSIRDYNSDDPLPSSGTQQGSSDGPTEQILMKKNSMMRGSMGPADGSGISWRAAVAAAVVALCAAATALALAQVARRAQRPGRFLIVDGQPPDMPSRADAPASLRR